MEKAGKKISKIKLGKVGKKRQHEVTLIAAYEAPLSWNQEPGPALPQLENINEEFIEYFARKGIKRPHGLFCFLNEQIAPYDEKVHRPTDAGPLIAAIQQRDKVDGQTEDFFAAAAIYFLGQLRVGIARFLNGEDSSPDHLFWIINTALQIQDFHTNFYLLSEVQPQYSAGKSRTTEAHEERSLKIRFENECENLFKQYRSQGKSKENCYELVADSLKKQHPRDRTPAKQTIKGWLKGRKDL